MKTTENYIDSEILTWIQSDHKGDQNMALKTLYQAHEKSIVKFVLKNNGNVENGKDVFQDALIIFFKNARKPSFELSTPIGGYIYSVSRNLWLKELRKNNRIVSLEDTEKQFEEIEDNVFAEMLTNEKTEMLKQIVFQLGENCRRILAYYYYDRMRMEQIAERMGYKNQQVAKNKKSKCLRALRELADKNMFFK